MHHKWAKTRIHKTKIKKKLKNIILTSHVESIPKVNHVELSFIQSEWNLPKDRMNKLLKEKHDISQNIYEIIVDVNKNVFSTHIILLIKVMMMVMIKKKKKKKNHIII